MLDTRGFSHKPHAPLSIHGQDIISTLKRTLSRGVALASLCLLILFFGLVGLLSVPMHCLFRLYYCLVFGVFHLGACKASEIRVPNKGPTDLGALAGLLHQFAIQEPRASSYRALYRVTRAVQGGGAKELREPFLHSLEGARLAFCVTRPVLFSA